MFFILHLLFNSVNTLLIIKHYFVVISKNTSCVLVKLHQKKETSFLKSPSETPYLPYISLTKSSITSTAAPSAAAPTLYLLLVTNC